MRLITPVVFWGVFVMAHVKSEPTQSPPLFKAFPALSKKIPYCSLGILPTPLYKAEKFAKFLNIKNFYIKRDDLSGTKLFDGTQEPGGNKVRKLEFLLADALKFDATSVLTVGDAGSNHALATTIYAKQVGLKTILMLSPQLPTAYARRNLLLDLYFGADIHYFTSEAQRDVAITKLARELNKNKQPLPYFIPMGGSSEIGNIGFVNAAFELKEQITSGQMPMPDVIYIALGTAGMSAGLILGVKAANLPCKIIPVRISMTAEYKTWLLVEMLNKTAAYLHSYDKTFPAFQFTEKDINMENDFAGPQYAAITEEAAAAIALLYKTEGIKLDGTYTGKALAALVAHAQKGALQDKTVLFWNSFSSGNYTQFTSKVDYKQLPQTMHYYFETPLQKLDQGF
jgi:D-cysteine desulfhydrase